MVFFFLFFFIFFFYNLDFRWLLGVDLVGCLLADQCLCFVLQHLLKFREISRTNQVFEH